jgi:DNA-binding LacI/PurR family transcriptional regulator
MESKTNGKAKTHLYYRHIYNYLLEQISAGKLESGDRIPSEKELCEKFAVSRITSKKALEMLVEQGVIFRIPGKGSFVGDGAAPRTAHNSSAVCAIGLVISDFNDAFGTRLLYAIEETCDALGYHLLLKCSRDSVAKEERALRSFNNGDTVGILLLPVHAEYYNREILQQILNKKPLVFVDRKMKGLPVPTVSTDNIAAAKSAIEYLLNLGHRNIAFYSGPMENISTVEERWNGFISAFNDKGITFDPAYFCLDVSEGGDMEAIKRHLAKQPEISAALVTEFSKAVIVKAAAESLGRDIPGDFSIITFDSPQYDLSLPRFTHIRQDEYTIGKRAVEILHAIITGADPAGQDDICILAQLVEGRSTAPPCGLQEGKIIIF